MPTMPTKALWSDAFAKLTVLSELGCLYADAGPLLIPLGIPVAVDKGFIKINWSYGAGAGSIQTGAGLPTGTNVNPAWVSGEYSKEFAGIASQAYTDVAVDLHCAGVELENSFDSALAAISDEIIAQLLGSNDGTDFTVWGSENFFALAMPIAAGMVREIPTISGDGVLLSEIETARAQLPANGYDICYTTTKGVTNLKKQIRTAGYATPEHLAAKDFGFDGLMYDGIAFFATRQATGDDDSTTFTFFNVGPQGIRVYVPGLEDPLKVEGPKDAPGYWYKVYDVAMALQVMYLSPRAAYKLQLGTDNP